jgi:hypothetical protein
MRTSQIHRNHLDNITIKSSQTPPHILYAFSAILSAKKFIFSIPNIFQIDTLQKNLFVAQETTFHSIDSILLHF